MQNKAECSSLKFFNFNGWTNEKIIEKYETVLASREKQITDLSMEIGSINDKINFLTDKCKSLQEENEMLKNRLQKRDNILAQELNNKEIMFMRLESKEQECDELKKKLEKYTKGGKDIMMSMKDMIIGSGKTNTKGGAGNNVSTSVNTANINNSTNVHSSQTNASLNTNLNLNNVQQSTQSGDSQKLSSYSSITSHTSESTTQNKPTASQPQKPSALDRIRELKGRKNNPSSSNRISLTSSIIEQNSTRDKETDVVSNEKKEAEENKLEEKIEEKVKDNSSANTNANSNTENNIKLTNEENES